MKIPYIVSLLLIGVGFYVGFTEGWLLTEAAPQLLVLGFIMLFTTIYLNIQFQNAENIKEFIFKNKKEILNGKNVKYKSFLINKNTELRRFYWAMSFVVICIKKQSGYYISLKHPVFTGLKFTLISFFFGWWGIPWGPFWTVEAIVKNFKGGEKIIVENMIKIQPKLGPEQTAASK